MTVLKLLSFNLCFLELVTIFAAIILINVLFPKGAQGPLYQAYHPIVNLRFTYINGSKMVNVGE